MYQEDKFVNRKKKIAKYFLYMGKKYPMYQKMQGDIVKTDQRKGGYVRINEKENDGTKNTR